jgi:UDP-N-acetylglucosamine--N-acetylmuramyl-(pentapeptide) pyrophosphoryl-undecaprenol N-acetylglucosamine transferase
MTRAILIASGGTGGHMFPATALGDALARRGHAVHYAVDRRGTRYLAADAARVLVPAASPTGSLPRRVLGLAILGLGLALSLVRLGLRRPAAVAAFGGYAAVPTGVAAGLLRVPLVLHEQNAVLGRGHRLLLRFARRIATSFPETRGVPAGTANDFVGNPVRAAFHDLPQAPPHAGVRLFVVGGSQGARVFSDVLPEAIGRLGAETRERLTIVQQCRREDLERVERAYAELGVAAELASFFDDVPARLAACDLVVSRAGASAVAEILVAARPAVLVAYPHAADDHQRANARALEGVGAAVAVDPAEASADRLAAVLAELVDEPDRRGAMAAAAGRLARPDAAERLADRVQEVMA